MGVKRGHETQARDTAANENDSAVKRLCISPVVVPKFRDVIAVGVTAMPYMFHKMTVYSGNIEDALCRREDRSIVKVPLSRCIFVKYDSETDTHVKLIAHVPPIETIDAGWSMDPKHESIYLLDRATRGAISAMYGMFGEVLSPVGDDKVYYTLAKSGERPHR